MMSKDIDALVRWLNIRAQHGYEFSRDQYQFFADIDHSALLRRLLEGKEPLPEPPPRSFSYPWYSVIEDGEGSPIEVWESPPKLFRDYPALIIDQFDWKILEKISDTEWIATYAYGRGDKVKWAEGKWRIYQIGSRVPQNPNDGSFNKLWKIEKL